MEAAADNQTAPEAANLSLRAMKWALGSVGVTGALYATGYIIEYAHQSLLGVVITKPLTIDYLLLGGTFFLDVWRDLIRLLRDILTDLPRRLWDHPLLTAAVLGGSLLLVVSARFLARRPRLLSRLHPFRRVRWWLGVLTVIILSVVEMFWLDWPLLPIDNLLIETATLDRHFNVRPELKPPVQHIWQLIVCSRITNDTEAKCGPRPDDYRRQLRDAFLLNFVLTLFLSLVGGLLAVKHNPNHRRPPALPFRVLRIVFRAILLLTLIHNIVALPYTYGKTIHSTDVREAILEYETGGDLDGLILAQDNRTITIFDTTHQQLLELSRTQVRHLRFLGTRTVPRIAFDRHTPDLSSRTRGYILQDTKGDLTVFDRDRRLMLQLPRSSMERLHSCGYAELREVRLAYETRKEEYRKAHAYILAENERSLILFEKSERQVWELPRERVRLAKVERLGDVLESHISFSYQRTPARSPGRAQGP